MAQATFSVRMDENLKRQFDALLLFLPMCVCKLSSHDLLIDRQRYESNPSAGINSRTAFETAWETPPHSRGGGTIRSLDKTF